MFETINEIFNRTWSQLYAGLTFYIPPLFVAFVVIAVAWLAAHFVRFLVSHLVKGLAFDRFLRSTGLSLLVRPQGELRTGPLAAKAVFWIVFLGGMLAAVSVFETQWTRRIVEAVVLLLPNVLTAAAILIAGLWLSLYLSRSVLLWAAEERMPTPRRWASAVRVVV
ncbi:MAG TPA: hypothetical protein VFV87_03015, partial [Pirellulaceae bacterium]|nr:hypothetical protein [Pirellulaceae bacterium]